jgi:outer membrane lipoprotein-sorting protein/peroxiredoxin
MKTKYFAVAVFFWLVAAVTGFTYEIPVPKPVDPQEAVTAIKARYAAVETLSASFAQETTTPDTKISLKGKVYFKRPRKIRTEVEITSGNADYDMRGVSVFDGALFWQQQATLEGKTVSIIKSKIDPAKPEGVILLEQLDPLCQIDGILRQYDVTAAREEQYEGRPMCVLDFHIKPEERGRILQTMAPGIGADMLPEEKIFFWDPLAGFCARLEVLNKQRGVLSIVTYSDVAINAGLDDAMFAYTPEPGVEVMDMTEIMGQENRKQEYEGTAHEKVGQLCPAFILPDLFGKKFDSAALQGKIVLIGFWAHWCPSCQKELPLIEKTYEDFSGDADVRVFTITDDKNKALEIAEKNGYGAPVLIDAGGVTAETFEVVSIPRVFVVDQQGKIAAVYIGYHEDIRDILTRHVEQLREAAAAEQAKREKLKAKN